MPVVVANVRIGNGVLHNLHTLVTILAHVVVATVHPHLLQAHLGAAAVGEGVEVMAVPRVRYLLVREETGFAIPIQVLAVGLAAAAVEGVRIGYLLSQLSTAHFLDLQRQHILW
jgi:hypothetical protein